MALSALDLFSVGIGPSSSHTVGPMRAAKLFADGLKSGGLLSSTTRVRAELFGSLGATGRGHGSDKAVVLGLQGLDPETVDTSTADDQVAAAALDAELMICGDHRVDFNWDEDVVLHRRKSLPAHPNGMTFRALDHTGTVLSERSFYSIGGGFVVDGDADSGDRVVADDTALPYPFTSADELLAICKREGMSISDVMLANELTWRSEAELREKLLALWAVMRECVDNGCAAEGILPGGLNVRRRAPSLFKTLTADTGVTDPLRAMEWVNLFALAVNEENAAGGRIVTAPTNGAAGIVPAVLHYYVKFVPGADDDGVVRFLLAAAAVGILFKINASISGAEVGCQGEVGSACSMAAAGLCEVLGGTPEQVENAAEVGIEHNLGLTCDPVGGLVQIPCIERNAIASVKAINAARLSLHGDGSHKVSLDKAIKTMRETGADMKTKYKETSRGGLAVNVIEC
ncbi:L-serine ammonia-lyase [Pseudarthrobacter sp. AL07]|uniref:L-serine ammonia-lyase n=1 Tax=unclassified Pseudarthrobacter TaxID=2647000 RepID=UPI00249CA1DE|nr:MULTISPECIES: L-serine ammonia-lyase [unclassified Pseudarthrobacter]MDI3196079.1 L-serine ammonia-lyase [Pseudarthrobacter sp. AL20]MDI3210131.1 L-serine ammonia-lyase [Pseudarthrobacter sp. AL07]